MVDARPLCDPAPDIPYIQGSICLRKRELSIHRRRHIRSELHWRTLTRKGVVLVSIAYRVGPLGFLAHPELSSQVLDAHFAWRRTPEGATAVKCN